MGTAIRRRPRVAHCRELVMPFDYYVLDFKAGRPLDEAMAAFNNLGADGWQMTSIELVSHTNRRAILRQTGSPMEYLIIDYDAGKPASELEADLDLYGADGWQ